MRGVVLRIQPYNDTLSIAYIYTRERGRESYLINRPAGNGKRSKGSTAYHLVAPLTEICFHERELVRNKMKYLSQISLASPRTRILSNPIKTSVAMLLAELLYALLQESHPDEELYDYIAGSLSLLEEATPRETANFHLCFILHLLEPLGVYPFWEDEPEAGAYFDLMAGCFASVHPGHSYVIEPRDRRHLLLFFRLTFDNSKHFAYCRKERREILSLLITYLRLHFKQFRNIATPDILTGK